MNRQLAFLEAVRYTEPSVFLLTVEGTMTRVHVKWLGDQAIVSRTELEQLVELARRSEPIELQSDADELPTVGIMQLAEQGGAFAWLADDEDLYSVNDLKVRYR
jgi:hypothetical protein